MEEIIKMLEKLAENGKAINSEMSGDNDINWEKSKRWVIRCKDLLKQHISTDEAKRFDATSGSMKMNDSIGNFVRHVNAKIQFLNSLKEDILNDPNLWKDKLESMKHEADRKEKNDPISIVTKICERFHSIARQLRHRHDNRSTLEIEDEYDVQDLIHALLKVFFNDIRPEEWTPSYAGKSSRMDFLLKNERLIIETKKTRQGLAHKEVGDQLIIDIDRYKQHPDCRTLFCFVYDPDGRIANPIGIENDLSRQEEDLEVKVFIAPRE